MTHLRAVRTAAAALALALALSVTACQSAPAAPPTSTPAAPTTAEPAPSPSETASLTLTEPVAPLAGGCDELLADAGVAAATGGAVAAEPIERWRFGIETAGGLACPFEGAGPAGLIVAVPDDRAPASGFDTAACEPEYDTVECVTSKTSGGVWVLVALLYGMDGPAEAPEELAALQEAASAVFDDTTGRGVDAAATTASLPLDCDALSTRLDVAARLEADEVYPTRVEEGSGPLERRVADALAVSGRCDWSELTDLRELGVVVTPGGAWAWEAAAATLPGAADVDVAGAEARVATDDGGRACSRSREATWSRCGVRGSRRSSWSLPPPPSSAPSNAHEPAAAPRLSLTLVVTRLSKFFLRTLREDPADAEVTSHKLLVRAGYIRRAAPGIFTWLPLGLRVKARIEAVVREEMAAAGAFEVHFPALLPRDPYEQSGRWTSYGDGIFRLQDRKGADYLLAPTHEEMFTLLVKDLYSSYKDLPLTIYQIQDKYRDEARPRAGLLRGREFTMKDAYSFDYTDEGQDASYQSQRDAYERIFQKLGLEYVIVAADNGLMGGARSEEFLHPTPVGEDTFVRSAGGYAANVEAFTTIAPDAIPFDGLPEPEIFDSPDTPTIETLVAHANAVLAGEYTAADTLKNVVLALTHLDGTRELVIVGLPGDRDIDDKRAEVAFAPAAVEPATPEDFERHPLLVKGYIGPWSPEGAILGEESATGIRYLLDPRVVEGTAWITGANIDQKHVHSLVAGRDFASDGFIEVASVRAGDPAPDGSGPVELARGMEIGHVFQLGRFFAETLGLKVLDENGKQVTVTMGSYGIGVTRILAIIAELNNDDRGLVWPESVAPFDVQVVATGKDAVAFDLAEGLSADLESAGLDVLYDDRPKVSPGVKFADAELIGVPRIVIVGRGAADGQVELWDRRTGDREVVPVADALARLTAR